MTKQKQPIICPFCGCMVKNEKDSYRCPSCGTMVPKAFHGRPITESEASELFRGNVIGPFDMKAAGGLMSFHMNVRMSHNTRLEFTQQDGNVIQEEVMENNSERRSLLDDFRVKGLEDGTEAYEGITYRKLKELVDRNLICGYGDEDGIPLNSEFIDFMERYEWFTASCIVEPVLDEIVCARICGIRGDTANPEVLKEFAEKFYSAKHYAAENGKCEASYIEFRRT